MLVSANNVNQLCVYVYPSLLNLLPKRLPIPPLYVITAVLPVLYGGFPLAIYFIHGSVYLSKLLIITMMPIITFFGLSSEMPMSSAEGGDSTKLISLYKA